MKSAEAETTMNSTTNRASSRLFTKFDCNTCSLFHVGTGIELNKSNVLVLVPAFNEQASVGSVIRNLRDHQFNVLLISDGSTDATASIAWASGSKVLELPINLGVGGALRAGFKYAHRNGFEAVVQVDADGQHPVSEIENLIQAANNSDAHMVIGSRFKNDAGKMEVSGFRRIVMRVLSRTASAAANEKISDSTSGFRVIRQPLLAEFSRQFANNYLGDTYEAVIAAGRAGYRVQEIPAGLLPRENGESTATTGAAIRFTLKALGVALLGIYKKLTPLNAQR
jgi:glycosyltransferase involved in cell wall biosynthesis